MACDGVQIGTNDGLPKNRRSWRGRTRISACPGLEKALGAVERVLVSCDRKDFDIPACLPEVVPKMPVGLSRAKELISGGQTRIDVGGDGLVILDDDGHLDVELPKAAVWLTYTHSDCLREFMPMTAQLFGDPLNVQQRGFIIGLPIVSFEDQYRGIADDLAIGMAKTSQFWG